MSDLIPKINSAIKFSFYIIFFFVPLAMWSDTFELFEFNKMWLVFIMAVVIFFLWGAKMVTEAKVNIRRTPLDIPIAIFLIAHLFSTIFSIDPHTSIWGYYSRFNGGLLSIISYIFLYYAFASNMIPDEADPDQKPISYKVLFVSLLSGLVVVLWGIPSHFGYDLTCFVFRGELNTGCWTEQFQPTFRMFSTLGQPNWLGTFLAVLIPITAGFGLSNLKNETKNIKRYIIPALYFTLALLFYIALIWTSSQSSFVGFVVAILVFAVLIILGKSSIREIPRKIFKDSSIKLLLLLFASFSIFTFFTRTPIETLNKFVTLKGITSSVSQSQQTQTKSKPSDESFTTNSEIIVGGATSSGQIRLIVWQGAIELFLRNPIFGTGVDTFAYAYYSVKPVAHNLTSEWDYLYNKAHNEYLNYLATTGILGFGSYMAIIGLFYFYVAKSFLKSKNTAMRPITIGIVAGLSGLLVSNFFGFAVVILNLFLFIFPLFFFELEKSKGIKNSIVWPAHETKLADEKLGTGRISIIVVLALIAFFMLMHLTNYWFADRAYALGYNLNRAGEYVAANPHLQAATEKMPGEDLYRDELSINLATIAVLFAQQNQATQAADFARQALTMSDEIIAKHPKNIVFLKTRARVAFALAQIEPSFIDLAIRTALDTKELAPTDAKLIYNLALFYNQKGDFEDTVKYMDEARKLKPNYQDVYYALALLYSEKAKEDPTKASEYTNLAKSNLDTLLKLSPNHPLGLELKKSLE